MKLFKNTILFCALVLAFTACSKSEDSQQKTTATANKQTAAAIPGMVFIPAGEFIMGSDDVDTSGKSEEFGFNEPWYLNEHPKRKMTLDAYYIDTHEVNNGLFKNYLMNVMKVTRDQLLLGVERMGWQVNEYPVRNVPWAQAQAYCESLGKRLPSEAEWEKAARGPNGNEFPWGNEFSEKLFNGGGEEEDLQAIGSYEKGKSHYGLYDMAGNVMEWVEDWYDAYPGSEYRSQHYGQKRKVARGGSWGGVGHYVIPHYFRTAYRYAFPPNGFYNDVGFRCAKSSPKPESANSK